MSRLLYEMSPKSLHELEIFQSQTIKWRYLNFTETNLRCHGNIRHCRKFKQCGVHSNRCYT